MASPDLPAPYGEGAFAPVANEITAWDLEVEGSIPTELAGTYLRNGSNPPPGPVDGTYHWFLADGMVHGVRLEAGRAVWYRNRWVRTETLAERLPIPAAGGPTDIAMAPNVANTSVVRHAGRTLALCEVGLPHEIDDELDTIGRYDFAGALATPMIAHPKIDPQTGEMFFLAGTLEPPHVRCHTVDSDGRLVRTDGVETAGPTLTHDMAITATYVVIADQPVVLDIDSIAYTAFPFAWSDDYQARLGLLPRSGDDREVRWFDVDAGFFIHVVNSYDDGNSVVVDVSRYPAGVLPRGAPDPLKQGVQSTYHRYRLHLETGATTEETMSDRSFDLPQVHPGRQGRSYRYGYGALLAHDDVSSTFETLAKWDLQTGSVTVHPGGDGVYAEPTFIPAHDATAEDEGWILSFRYDPATDRSSLVVLDAIRLDAEPQAVIHLPQRVPLGFHGTWLPDDGR